MTQSTTQIGAGQSGLAYRTADNDGKRALLNHHKGGTAPDYAEAGIIWLDDAATPWLLKTYDGADWITLGEVNATTNTFQPHHGTAAPRLVNHAADTGSANAYAIAPAPALTAYAAGQVVTLKPANASTGACTVNVNSLGTKSIKLLSGSNPASGALLTTGIYMLVYDGTNFVVLNPSADTVTVTAPYRTTSSTTTLAAADLLGRVELTGSTDRTWSLTAAATLTGNWSCVVHNNSTALLTLDPNSSEQIDGLTTLVMYPGEIRRVDCTGTAFKTAVLHGMTATFSASGSFTVPPGYAAFALEIISGGGAGASRATTGNASGGAGSGVVMVTLPSSAFVAAGSTETITVAGTAAGVSGNANGTAGNNSAVTVNGTAITYTGTAAATHAASSSATTGGDGGSFSHAGYVYAGGSNGGAVTSGNAPQAVSNVVMGGGCGGGCSSTAGGTRTGATSMMGGHGGAGGANTGGNGTNGTAPGGGGGGAVQGGTSGSGAAGRVTIRGII